MKRFLKEVTKSTGSLAIYGEDQIRNALSMGALDVLLLSESLRKYRIKISCTTCSYSEEKTISEDNFKDYVPPLCNKCETPTSMQVVEKKDLIDELSDLADKIGCTVKLISQNSEEGDALFSAFGGIAGISRYPLEIEK